MDSRLLNGPEQVTGLKTFQVLWWNDDDDNHTNDDDDVEAIDS